MLEEFIICLHVYKCSLNTRYSYSNSLETTYTFSRIYSGQELRTQQWVWSSSSVQLSQYNTQQPDLSTKVSTTLWDGENAFVGQIQFSQMVFIASTTLHLLSLCEESRMDINCFRNTNTETQVRSKKRKATNGTMLRRYTPNLRPAGYAHHNKIPLCLKTKPVCFETELRLVFLALGPVRKSSENEWTSSNCDLTNNNWGPARNFSSTNSTPQDKTSRSIRGENPSFLSRGHLSPYCHFVKPPKQKHVNTRFRCQVEQQGGITGNPATLVIKLVFSWLQVHPFILYFEMLGLGFCRPHSCFPP